MTNAPTDPVTAESVRENIRGFLEQRTRTQWGEDTDLFESGSVNSLFALELIVHVENTFGLAIRGPDLTLANFRTVNTMTALVLRLRGSDE
ncbi:acyl carrier protein [Amycolatopsis lurida]